MDCQTNFEDLMAYVDGDLSPDERRRVATHIVECPECRATVDDLKAVSGVLTKWAAPDPVSLPSAQELLARAAQPDDKKPGGPRFSSFATRWGALAASLVVAVLLGGVFLEKYRTGQIGETSKAPIPTRSEGSAPEAAKPASPSAVQSPTSTADGGAAPGTNELKDEQANHETKADNGPTAPATETPGDQRAAGFGESRTQDDGTAFKTGSEVSPSAGEQPLEPPKATETESSRANGQLAAAPAPPPEDKLSAEPAPAEKQADAVAQQPRTATKPAPGAFGNANGGRASASVTERIATDDQKAVLARVSALAKQNGGSVVSQSGSGAERYIRIRVPQNKVDDIRSAVRGLQAKGKNDADFRRSRERDDDAKMAKKRKEQTESKDEEESIVQTVVVIIEPE